MYLFAWLVHELGLPPSNKSSMDPRCLFYSFILMRLLYTQALGKYWLNEVDGVSNGKLLLNSPTGRQNLVRVSLFISDHMVDLHERRGYYELHLTIFLCSS